MALAMGEVEEEEGDSRARGHLAGWRVRLRLAARRRLWAHGQISGAHGQFSGAHGQFSAAWLQQTEKRQRKAQELMLEQCGYREMLCVLLQAKVAAWM